MRIVIVALMLVIATSALAQNPYDGHMYLSAAPDTYKRELRVEKFELTPFYLILEDEFPEGLGAWEARVVNSSPAAIITDVTLHPEGTAINVSLTPDSWVVGTACQAVDLNGKFLLATFHVLATQDLEDEVLELGAVSPPLSTFTPMRGGDGVYTPGWVGCYGLGETIYHATVEDADADTPGTENGILHINFNSAVSNQDASWGMVKAQF